MTSEIAARCRDVVKIYRSTTAEVQALHGVSADFPRGAVTVVSGPSGSGKSTLLRLLAGLDRPTSGSIDVDDARVDSASGRALRQLRRRHVSYVFQRPSDNFLPYLTVRDHVALALRDASRLPDDADELLEELGIAGRLDHLPAQLSGGEQQRAALATVLAGGSGVVLTDEPTAAVDTATGAALLTTMRRLSRHGVTFVVASHDPLFRRGADRLVELHHGRIEERRRAPSSAAIRPLDRRHGAERHPRAPVVAVEGVTKEFRRGDEVVHAVRDVTVSLHEGELAALVGRSGSGKTTLLNLIAGWEAPDAGTVSLPTGGEIPSWRELAVLPQKLGLFEELTVRENVEYPARLAGEMDGDVAERMEELIDELGLADLADRQPRETSVGEQQRCALARAVVLSPRVLLADEPTGHQDDRWSEAVFRVLERAASDGTTCLVATHDEALIPHLDRVIPMSDGRILGGPGGSLAEPPLHRLGSEQPPG